MHLVHSFQKLKNPVAFVLLDPDNMDEFLGLNRQKDVELGLPQMVKNMRSRNNKDVF
jgi:hypothetical protein